MRWQSWCAVESVEEDLRAGDDTGCVEEQHIRYNIYIYKKSDIQVYDKY